MINFVLGLLIGAIFGAIAMAVDYNDKIEKGKMLTVKDDVYTAVKIKTH